MKIFAYEHITGGGMLGAPLPPALRSEGELMLRALVTDLAAIPHVHVVTTCDPRVDLSDLPAERRAVHDPGDWRAVFAELVETSDALWPIAPETGGVLESVSRMALAARRILLNSPPDAVGLAGSKRRTAEVLAAAGVAVIPTFTLDEPPPSRAGAWVIKPDDGCGCQETRLWDDFDAAERWIKAQAAPEHYVLQPYVPGTAASLSALARDGACWVLSVNRQRIVMRDDCFVFLGSVVNGVADENGCCRRLAERVTQAIPGLWGYVGIDFLLGAHAPVVVEINPRLTTSYVGLSAALDCNPAALVLELLDRDRPFRLPSFHPRRIDVDVATIEGPQ